MTSALAMFEEQVARVPDATAVVAGERRTTYRELNRLAGRFAHRLTSSSGELTGVCLGRDEQLVAGLLAVWKAGRGYVPLDASQPVARLAAVIKQAGLRQVLTSAELAPVVVAAGAQPVLAEDEEDTPGEVPRRPAGPEDVAYVLFTSGSTGTPKGVVIEHRNVAALLRWVRENYDPGHLRGGLASASVSFDQSVLHIFGPLTNGGTVIMADDVLSLPTLPARDEVTMIGATPSALATLLEHPLPAGVLRVNVGAERITRAVARRIYANPGVELVVNVYGPTECTVACAMHLINRDEPGDPPIGRAVAGSELSVRDADQRPVGEGEAGELWVAGPLVGRGYLDAPGATANAFVHDTASAGGRRYRTGDLVRSIDGVLHYLGRMDDQVKVRGFRVEPGEVESALAAHPAVRHAVALAPADEYGTRVLHAHVELRSGMDVTEAELSRFLRERLPHYLVPSRILVHARLPLLTSGKVHRAALPPVDQAPAETAVEPRDETEGQVAAIVSAVLNRTAVGVLDRFDELGGHSLAAARVLARIRTELGAAVPLEQFLAEPTVAGLARRITAGTATPVPAPTRPAAPTTVPLSDMQRQLWTMRQVSGLRGVTTEAFRLAISGVFTTQALGAALNGIVARHEALRTVVGEEGGLPVGLVRPPAPVELTEHHLRETLPDDRQEAVARAARQSFDPGQDVPLLRAELFRTGPEAAELVIAVDHLGFDGWSAGLLIEELAAGLGAPGTPLPAPAVQLGDVARYEQDLFAAAAGTNTAFWRTELEGALPPYSVSGRPRTGAPGHRGARLVRPVPPELVNATHALCAASGISEFAGYLAALDVLLGRLTASSDILVGVPVARRDLVELDRIIGPLLSVLPVRVRWSPEQTFRSVAALAALATGRSLAHGDLPAADLAREAESAGAPRPPGVPLTPVLLSMRPTGTPVLARHGSIEVESLGELDTGAAQNEATFLLNTTSAGTEIQLCYAVDRYDETTAAALLDGFLGVLAAGTADPDEPCSVIKVPELALPAGDAGAAAPGAPDTGPVVRVEPATVVEEFLAETWQQLLGLETGVAASDSFFLLGGNSLTAIRLTRAVWEALGIELAVRTVFELPVLSDLASVVEQRALATMDTEGDAS